MKGNRYRLPGFGLLLIAIHGDDRLDAGASARFANHHLVPYTGMACGHGAREATEVEVGPVHPLHGEAEGQAEIGALHVDGFEQRQKRRTIIPWRVGAFRDHIVTIARRDRHRMDALELEAGGKGLIIGNDLIKDRLVVAHQVHLVDRQHHMAHADQRVDEAVAPGLGLNTIAGIDQNDGKITVGRTGDHVAGILLMAGGIGDDEFALVGRKEAIGPRRW